MRWACIIALVLTACAEDVGMLQGICGPIVLPVEVVNAGTSDYAIQSAIDAWNDKAPLPFFALVEEPSGPFGWATVTEGDPVAEGHSVGGYAEISWAHGEILTCAVVVAADLSYDPYWHVALIEHELGHCLGLADDPPSIDLGSIMSDPFRWGASPTDSDVDVVLRGCSSR